MILGILHHKQLVIDAYLAGYRKSYLLPFRSFLLRAIKYLEEDYQMPPAGKLPDAVIADFVKWIDMGAPDPRQGKAPAAAKRARSPLNKLLFLPPSKNRLHQQLQRHLPPFLHLQNWCRMARYRTTHRPDRKSCLLLHHSK